MQINMDPEEFVNYIYTRLTDADFDEKNDEVLRKITEYNGKYDSKQVLDCLLHIHALTLKTHSMLIANHFSHTLEKPNKKDIRKLMNDFKKMQHELKMKFPFNLDTLYDLIKTLRVEIDSQKERGLQ